VDVKHSSAFSAAPIENEVADTLHRGLADAVIVSGAATGSPTPVAQLEAARRAAGEAPVLVGSGVSDATARRLSSLADGMIVGSCLKRDGVATNPVDVQRVRNLVAGL